MILHDKIIRSINQKTKNEFLPFYLYDSELIREHCRLFRDIRYQDNSVHFASMANIHPHFLKIVKEEGIHIFVNSLMHMNTALEAGFNGSEIIFTASALSESAMKEAFAKGAQVNLDSPGQLELWQKLFPGHRVGIRCNIGDSVAPYSSHAGYFIGKESRLGFTPEEIDAIPDKSVIAGLHLYIGTDVFDIGYFMSCYRALAELSLLFPDIDYLNFGGGFGVAENGENHFDFETYNQRVSEFMEEVSRKRGKPVKLILEPGRIIGGESGFFVCRVTDVKQRIPVMLVGVNASTVQFSRPLFYPEVARHPVAIIRNGIPLDLPNECPTTIFGCSTYSRDIFTKNLLLPVIKPGDILVFGNAGSYSASSYTSFLGFSKPEEYFI
jgi:diaminopimelate decarboxylase